MPVQSEIVQVIGSVVPTPAPCPRRSLPEVDDHRQREQRPALLGDDGGRLLSLFDLGFDLLCGKIGRNSILRVSGCEFGLIGIDQPVDDRTP